MWPHSLDLLPVGCLPSATICTKQFVVIGVSGRSFTMSVSAAFTIPVNYMLSSGDLHLAGDSWAHAATSRVILYWQEQLRYAYLYKSPSLPARRAEFVITSDGVRGRRPPKRARPVGLEGQ